jgi:hypothetical protein
LLSGLARRLLLDRRHRSVALVSQSGAVLGGITYRVFGTQVESLGLALACYYPMPWRRGAKSTHSTRAIAQDCCWSQAHGILVDALVLLLPQGLGEIAFCAVAANQQVRGFGTRLMNHTKAMARDKDGLTHFLTYADNNAVGYFSKQVGLHACVLARVQGAGHIRTAARCLRRVADDADCLRTQVCQVPPGVRPTRPSCNQQLLQLPPH